MSYNISMHTDSRVSIHKQRNSEYKVPINVGTQQIYSQALKSYDFEKSNRKIVEEYLSKTRQQEAPLGGHFNMKFLSKNKAPAKVPFQSHL